MIKSLFVRAIYNSKDLSQLVKYYFGRGRFTFEDEGVNYPESSVSLPFEKLGWDVIFLKAFF